MMDFIVGLIFGLLITYSWLRPQLKLKDDIVEIKDRIISNLEDDRDFWKLLSKGDDTD